MEYKNFEEVVKKARGIPRMRRGIVAGAEDLHVLEAVFEAKKEGIAFPVLAGDAARIAELVKSLGHGMDDCRIVDVPAGENPAQRAVDQFLLNEFPRTHACSHVRCLAHGARLGRVKSM